MKNTTQLHLEKRITTMAIVYAHGNVMIYAGYNLKELQQMMQQRTSLFFNNGFDKNVNFFMQKTAESLAELIALHHEYNRKAH